MGGSGCGCASTPTHPHTPPPRRYETGLASLGQQAGRQAGRQARLARPTPGNGLGGGGRGWEIREPFFIRNAFSPSVLLSPLLFHTTFSGNSIPSQYPRPRPRPPPPPDLYSLLPNDARLKATPRAGRDPRVIFAINVSLASRAAQFRRPPGLWVRRFQINPPKCNLLRLKPYNYTGASGRRNLTSSRAARPGHAELHLHR